MEGLEDLQIQINRLKSQAGMVSVVNSAVPMYMRNDLDTAYDMEDFLQHDITQDIPYGRSSFRQPTTRSDNQSAAGMASGSGYASLYNKNRTGVDSQQQHLQNQPYGGGANKDLGMISARPLDTVSEDRDSQEDWNLLSAVAYGTAGDQGGENAKPNDPATDAEVTDTDNEKLPLLKSRAGSNHSKGRRSQNGQQTPTGRQQQQQPNSKRAGSVTGNEDNVSLAGRASQASLGRRGSRQDNDPWATRRTPVKTPERAVTRNNNPHSGMITPHDDAQEVSPKGAGRAADTPTKGSAAFNNHLDWEPATPTKGRRSNMSGKDEANDNSTKSERDHDTKEKEPMSNRLDWQPVTPTNDVNTDTKEEDANKKKGDKKDDQKEEKKGDQKDDKNDEDNDKNNHDRTASAEEILAQV